MKLQKLTLKQLLLAFEWRVFALRNKVVRWEQHYQATKIMKILSDPNLSVHYDSEEVFEKLQNNFSPPPPYGYNLYAIWSRAVERVSSILSIPEMQWPGRKILEIGAGDGVTGGMLSDYGHLVTLCDLDDWRDKRALKLAFLQCDVCQNIPAEDESFDFIYSYNTFEHLLDPLSAFREIERVSKPDGLILLSLGPLYCSPWGLHAYRALNMPYPQFIFSRPFVENKVRELGIYDLGKEKTTLQPLNQWRLEQYSQLWKSNPCFRVLEQRNHEDWSHLKIVMAYPEAFFNQGLIVSDLVTQSVHILLKRVSFE